LLFDRAADGLFRMTRISFKSFRVAMSRAVSFCCKGCSID